MPNSPAYLAFDLGASGSRALLGYLDGDSMQMEEVHRFPTPIVERGPHLFWDIETLWEEIGHGLQEALSIRPDLRSVSVDSWAIDYVPLTPEGAPMRLPHCYRDPRTDGVMERAFNTVPPEEIYARTGIQFLGFNTLYQLLSDQVEETRSPQQPASHLTIADYFNYRLSGNAAIEVSMASTTQMMDVHAKTWSTSLLEALGLDASKWPSIVPSGTRLGAVRSAPEVAVVASCSHDTACAVAAAPAVDTEGGWAFVSCGTWSLFGAELSEPLLTDDARRRGFTNEAGIDDTIRFLKNLTGLWALQECAREWGEAEWPDLEREARAASTTSARIDLEDPRFVARGAMEKRLLQYCREVDAPVPETRGQLVRVVLESIAESYKRTLNDLEKLTNETIDTVYLFGGGARNRLLCELTADACDVRVIAGPAEATALGNLLIQARSMDDLPPGVSIRDAAAQSSDLRVYNPNVQTV